MHILIFRFVDLMFSGLSALIRIYKQNNIVHFGFTVGLKILPSAPIPVVCREAKTDVNHYADFTRWLSH